MSADHSASTDDVAPLPEHPDLEYERKRARKLLRAMRPSKPDAKLADAQFTVARGYGFASWPKLVAYFATWERHRRVQRSLSTYRIDWYQRKVADLLRLHAARAWSVTAQIATYVPRLFGAPDEQVFAAALTEADARLVIARVEGFGSWDGLTVAADGPRPEFDPDDPSPLGRFRDAIRTHDIGPDRTIYWRQPRFDDARALVVTHPELLSGDLVGDVIAGALFRERDGSAGASEFVDWLVARGCDVRAQATRMLRAFRTTPEQIARLLARGADPRAELPGAVPLIEHALLRYWNGAAVDVILRHVKPRKAFWIAAGVGDTRTLERYFVRDGVLTDAVRRDRPDYTMVGLGLPCRPDVDDRDIIWEAFFIAAINGRTACLDVLLRRGHDIDYSPWRSNALHMAVGNRMVETVELLVARGANADLRGFMPDATPREAAAADLQDRPDDPAVRRICAVLGIAPPSSSPASITAER